MSHLHARTRGGQQLVDVALKFGVIARNLGHGDGPAVDLRAACMQAQAFLVTAPVLHYKGQLLRRPKASKPKSSTMGGKHKQNGNGPKGQGSAQTSKHVNVNIGERVFSDFQRGAKDKQGILSYVVAVISLTIYCG